ncbi:MAG: PEP-CTERM sorting domain-containing protein [Sedimentisphaerales bacterium]|nr:PEP-CTERM sorting domain-containing protein [Sedimentisphaerales bacterium]
MLASAAFAGPNAGDMPYGAPATIDGDISDWAGAAWRTGTLQMGYYTGGAVAGNEDLDLANMRWTCRWNDNDNVYAVMQVIDSNPRHLDAFTEWCATDRVEWFVHGENNQNVTYHSNMQDAQQYVMSPMASDDSQCWIEMGYKKGAPITGMAGAVSVSGNTVTYEVSIPVFEVFGGFSGATTVPTDLAVGMTIGFDVLVGSRLTPYTVYDAAPYYLVDETGVSSGTVHKADGPSDGMQEFTLVPEPMTMSLLALGGLGLIRRRK